MLYSNSVATPIGTIRLSADADGLTAIILPCDGCKGLGGKAGDVHMSNTCLDMAAQQILEYCEGKRTEFDLPLSMNGTSFQRQVWDIIRRIPYGKTMSYGEIARHLGSTGKARAVGGAAHANRLPLVIPCHRVIGSDGSLTGFAGGVALKKRLLRMEKNTLRKQG